MNYLKKYTIRAPFFALVFITYVFHMCSNYLARQQQHIGKLYSLSVFLPYVGLGLFTFFTVILILPSTSLFSTQPIIVSRPFTNAIINSQDLEASISASVISTPSAAEPPTPTSFVSSATADQTALPLSQDSGGEVGVTPAPSITAVSTNAAKLAATPSADFCINVPVLMYHHIQPLSIAQPRGQDSLTVDTSVFDQQMQYLVNHGYKTISAEELVLALHNHTYLPPTDVVLTFDDGYIDNYTDAFPIAKKYHVILNIMVPTGLLDTHPDNTDNYYFSWPQLKEMVSSGLVNAYDHSWSHFPIGTGTFDKNQFEIMTPKQQLEQNLNRTIDIFAYPYGSGQDMIWVENLLKKDGFIGAFSTIGGSDQCESFVMSLHRYHVGSAYFPGFGIN